MNTNRETVEYIKDVARKNGACEIVEGIRGWKTLANTLKSPQGIEFMAKHSRKKWMLDLFRDYKAHVRRHGIYVDEGPVEVEKSTCAAFVGQTQACVKCHGVYECYVFIVMAGASLIIKATDYAVVRVHNLGGSVTIKNDGTAKILE